MARLILSSGEAVGLSSGTYTVFGTATGSETVSFGETAVVTFDASFNAGGDTIDLAGNAADYTVVRSGSQVILTNASGGSFTIPVGTAGATISFDDGDRALAFNSAAGQIELGDQAITTTASQVTAGTGAAAETAGEEFQLTAGVDRLVDFTGTAGNDTFLGSSAAGAVTLTSLDSLDGGAGTDVLEISAIGAIDTATAVGASVTGIEIADLVATTSVDADTTDWTGLTSLTAVGLDSSSIAAAETTDVALVLTSLAFNDTVAVDGGADVSVTTTVAATAAGAASASIDVGATTAAAGDVVVSNVETVTDDAGATAHTSSTISVTGGTSVTISNLASGGANDDAADIITIGQVTVTGDAGTSTVSVTQSAAAARAATAMGVTSGAVIITDGNLATASDTITDVTLVEYGAGSSITSTVLANLTLNGAATAALAGDLTIDQSAADVSTAATTLTVNLLGGHTGAIDGTQADVYTTVNFNASAASTISDVNFAAATALNFTGTAAATLAAATDIGAVTSISNTGTGAVTITPALDTGVTYTGGEGVDTISVGATTAAITTGDGNDNVTIGAAALGTGGSVDAGAGDADVLTMTFANAATASAATTFETTIAGFERLAISGDVNATATVALANLDDINYVTVGNVATGQTAAITGAQSGFTLVNNTGTTGTGAISVALANDGSADVVNVSMSATSAQDLQSLVVNDAETLNFLTDDSAATTTGIAHLVSSLTAGDLTTLTVAGDAGLNVTYTGTSLTTFDASGVTDGAVTYTTGALAAASTITGSANDGDNLNASSAAAAVAMFGLGGNDILTGSSAQANTIDGGAGNDTITGGSVADVVDGGAGTDTFVADLTEQAGASTTSGAVINLSADALTQAAVFTATGAYLSAAAPTVASNSATYLFDSESTTNTSVVDTLASIENATGTTGEDYIVGSASANVITGGAGADTLFGGAGADTFVIAADAVDNILDLTAADDFISTGTAADTYEAIVDDGSIAGAATVADAVAAAYVLAAAGNDAGVEAIGFVYDGNNYIAVEAAAGTDDAGAFVAQVDDLTDLAAANFIA